jgi:hemolysin III
MRGWLHLWSFAGSVAASIALVWVTAVRIGGPAAIAATVYGATTLGLFGTSALYHRRIWNSTRSRGAMKRLDHSMIFLFIAGTYTAVAGLALPTGTARWVLAVAWAGSAAGTALAVLWPSAPAWVGVPVYLALGWVAVLILPDVLHSGGVSALVLLVTGGALYTVGSVFYATRWPNPWPRTFGYHEFFHAATVLAALCQHVAIWLLLFQ